MYILTTVFFWVAHFVSHLHPSCVPGFSSLFQELLASANTAGCLAKDGHVEPWMAGIRDMDPMGYVNGDQVER